MFDLLFIQLGRFHPLLSTKYQCHGWKIGLISSRLLLLPFVPLLGKKMMFPTTNFSTRVQVIPDALFRDSWPLELYKIGLWGFKASCFLFYCGFDTTKVRSSIHFCCPHKSWQVLKELCQQTDRRNFCPNLNWTTEQTVDETSVVFSIWKRGRKVTLKVRS